MAKNKKSKGKKTFKKKSTPKKRVQKFKRKIAKQAFDKKVKTVIKNMSDVKYLSQPYLWQDMEYEGPDATEKDNRVAILASYIDK